MAVTFAIHYYAFRRVLQTVLLPMHQSVLFASLLDDTLLSLVRKIVAENRTVYLSAALTAAEYLLRKDSPSLSNHPVGSGSRTATIPSSAPLTGHHGDAEAAGPQDCGDTATSSTTMPLEQSSSLVSVLLNLVEDCGDTSIQYHIASALHSMCFASGQRVSTAAFEKLIASGSKSQEGMSAAAHPGLTMASISVQRLKEVVEALGQCIDGYRRTRGAILIFAGADRGSQESGAAGTSARRHPLLSPWGEAFLTSAFQGYVAGVAALEQLESIVEMAAVPLWLQACQEAYKSKHGEDRLDELRQIRVHPADFLHVETPVHGSTEEKPSGGIGGGMDSTSPVAGAAPASCAGISLHPSDGYPSMLFLLSAIESSRKRFLPVLRRCIATYFSEQLELEDDAGENDVQDNTLALLLPLPPLVVEQCIYVLKMTRQCFEKDAIQRVMLVEHPPQLSSPLGTVPGWTFCLLEVAMDTTLSGIRQFFLTCEKRAAATLAHTLDYHIDCIVARQSSYVPDIHDDLHTEAVHTLLDLATLLTDSIQFAKIYADLIAPKVILAPSLSSLDVFNWVAALMECHIGYTGTAPCFLLLRDVMEALQDQRYICSKYPESASGGRGGAAGDVSRAVLRAAATASGLGSGAAGNGSSGSPSGTLRLSLGSISPLSARHNPLLRRLNVLRFGRWKPYATLLQSSKSIIKMFERGGFLSEDFVDAVLRAEWCYDGNHAMAYQGYGSFRFPRNHLGSILSNGSVDGEDDGRSSIARISQSTSSMVVGLSSALSSAVQQAAQTGGLSAFTSNGSLGNDDYDDDAAFSGAYGGVLRQEASASYPTMEGRSGSFFSSRHSQTSRHTNHSNQSHLSSVSDTSLRVEEKRKIRWSLGIGMLTFTIKELTISADGTHIPHPGPTKSSRMDTLHPGASSTTKPNRVGAHTVTVTGPPVCLIILQLLNRMASAASPLSFSLIVSYLPLRVPKEVVGQVLKSYLSAGLVQRVLKEQGYAYFMAATLASVPRRLQVVVQYKNPMTTDPNALSNSAATPQKPGGWGAAPTVRSGTTPGRSDTYPSPSPPSLEASASKTPPPTLTGNTEGHSGGSETIEAEKLKNEKCRWKVDVAVMRLLKEMGGTVPHGELLPRVTSYLEPFQFAVSPVLFKSSISYLLERDCIFRHGENAYGIDRPPLPIPASI